MPWPLSQDYNEAIQSPQTSLADPELRGGEAAVNAMGLPQPCSGNFADVYRFHCASTGRTWAVKCFTRQIPGLRERYQQISLYLKQLKLPFMVDFTFLERGVRVRGDWYPILKMEWAEGVPLNEFVKNHLEKPQVLEKLCQIWVKLASRLREANLAHCDLQHGNVLLVPSKTGALSVKLVDYDGMCVPSLTMLKALEVGHPSYQHSQRLREGIFNLEVDRFSHLVIYTALRSLLAGGKSLWERYDNGDNMLFRQDDFKAPGKSPLFKELLQLSNAEVRRLAQVTSEAAQKPMERTPLLSELLPDEPVSAPPPGKSARAQPALFAVSPARQSPAAALAPDDDSKTAAADSSRARRRKTKTQQPWRPSITLVACLGGLLFLMASLGVLGIAILLNGAKTPSVVKNNTPADKSKADAVDIEVPVAKPPKMPETGNPVGTTPESEQKLDKQKLPEVPETKVLPVPETKLPPIPETKLLPVPDTKLPPIPEVKLPPVPNNKELRPKELPDPIPVAENKAPWVDLLKLIAPSKQRITGKWTFEGAVLVCDGRETARLQIPYQPPEEYILRISVESVSAREFWIALALPHSQCTICFDCNAPNYDSSGLQLIDGQGFSNNGTLFKGPLFTPSKHSEILCTVRKQSIAVMVDGQPIIVWEGDFARLSMDPRTRVPDARALAIGSNQAVTRIHRMEIKSITGQGRIVQGFPHDEGELETKKKALALRLTHTEWITSTNNHMDWFNDGDKMYFDGAERRIEVVDGKTVKVVQGSKQLYTLVFDDGLGQFEQFGSSGAEAGPVSKGKRVDSSDWKKAEVSLVINGKGKLVISDKGMRWLNISGTPPNQVIINDYSWNLKDSPNLPYATMSKVLGEQLDLGRVVLVQQSQGQETVTVEKGNGFIALVFDQLAKPGPEIYDIHLAFRIKLDAKNKAFPIIAFPGHAGSVNDLALHPNGLFFATCGEDKTVRYYDVKKRMKLWQIDMPDSQMPALCFSADGQSLWVAVKDEVYKIEIAAQRKVAKYRSDYEKVHFPIQASLDDNYVWFPFGTNRLQKLVVQTGNGNRFSLHPNSKEQVFVLAISSDNRRILTSGLDKTLRLYEDAGKVAAFAGRLLAEPFVAQAGAFSPDEKQAAAIERNTNRLAIWDIATTKQLVKITMQKDFAPATTMAFSPDGRRLVVGHEDGLITLWDSATLKGVFKTRWQPSRINRVIFLPDSRTVLCAATNGSIGMATLPE